MIDIGIIFKIAGAGIIMMVLDKVLEAGGKKEIATITNLVGIIVILIMVISLIGDLFNSIKTMFIM
ncbi:MAG: stage III sporulation protein AC [Clostridium sp.]|uniref:stage III sporulation protein AC n=1 Tax=Clostridium TaxID=1485 RepID=UPI00215393AB|nr:stage III sporulation protein AC [Clostridium sp. LY3-2]MCR6515869.1 stage III sporulation protein AC [Clostridium sp. LY3-2]